MMTPRRQRAIYERRYLRRGGCVVCGRPRGQLKRVTDHRRRRSKRFCAYHRVYQDFRLGPA